MRTFRCVCGARLFFENSRCLACKRELGFLPDVPALVPLDREDGRRFSTPWGDYSKCANYVDAGVCTWMVPASSSQTLCQACRLNHVIPDLSRPENRLLWAEVEKAKRRVVYTLNQLKLPLQSKQEDPQRGIAFDIKSDVGSMRVLTGHDDGLITLNLAEADAAEREKMRVAMSERYRTMLGHFRHEVGHYYWERLVRDTPNVTRFRILFGDETVDYAQALKRHYATEPSPEYAESFISTYASAHPWEDFAETFAHYLHMVDTMETAHDFNLQYETIVPKDGSDFESLMKEWAGLTIALNELNRSMGLADAYPFAISQRIGEKLAFVHALLGGANVVANAA
jgi:hypothetical protein